MKKIIEIFKTSIKQIGKHYEDAKDIITRNNAIILMSVSSCGIVFVSLLLFITPLMISTWHMTVGHWLLLPFFVIFALLGMYGYREKLDSYQWVHVTVLAFAIILMSLIIYANVVAFPNNTSVLVPLAMVAIPVIFVLPFHEIVLYLSFTYLVLLLVNNQYVAGAAAHENLFNFTAGLFVGISAAWINTNIRAEENQDRQEIVRKSSQDKLTGIWNKSSVEKKCFTYLEGCREESCALIVIDIDSFKNVNDTLGHHGGDEVLSVFGASLRKVFRSSDIIGRIGGDEFIVLMKNITSAETVQVKMNTLVAVFHGDVFEELNYKVTCSYGAILKGAEPVSYLPLFEMADKILYRAKKNGKNQGEVLTISDYNSLISQKKIMLVVDDSEMNRMVLKEVFEERYEILEAEDGQKAIDAIQKHHSILDIVLLDVIMPEVNGFQVLEWMEKKKYLGSIPVVAISSDESAELQALKMGVSDMISKPFETEVLRRRVENVLKNL